MMELVENTDLTQRIADARSQGMAMLQGIREKLAKLSFTDKPVVIPEFDAAKFTLEHDKYNDQQSLLASFYLSPTYRAGVILFHSDGSCFAEYHVMRDHPTRPQFFIESIEAWVKDGEIKTDLKTILKPE